MMRHRWLIASALVVISASCTTVEHDTTSEMAALLDSIAQHTEDYPRGNAHANRARVRALREVTPPTDPAQYVTYAGMLGQELLRAGYTEAAIEQFKEISAYIEENPSIIGDNYLLGILDHLALSYLRLGEQENCIANHNTERCLLPITGEGIHTLERGSLQAISVYSELLRLAPDDLNSLWLLNLAYMTLGKYPEKVPPEWLIPQDALVAEDDIGRFIDISRIEGVDVQGLSGGVVMEDLNGDGLLDIMVSSWGLRDPLRLFVNQGEGRYDDRSGEAGIDGLVGGLNLVHADYDNDGDRDILVLRGAWLAEGHPNSLLQNQGDATFKDVTHQAGLLSFHPTQTATWADFDNDGDLDLFIGNESNPKAGRHYCEYFENLGDGTFLEAADQKGLRIFGYVKAVVSGDYDNDGWMDLFVSRYGESNLLFRNINGTWFEEVGAEAGVLEPYDSFPAWFWDYNNDGWQDLFVSGWRATAGDVAAEFLGLPGQDEHPRLYHNNGDGTFTDKATEMGLDRVMYTMGSNYGDLNNDGWLDFYVGTGDPDLRALMPNRMFLNDEGRRFLEVTSSGGFGHLQKGHGIAFGDVDEDGDQDIYAVMGGAFEGDLARNLLFDNPGHGNNWITLELEGTTSNHSALGAIVRVETDSLTIHRVVSSGGSFGSSPLRREIGLGKVDSIRSITVFWPASGITQNLGALATNQLHYIIEPNYP